MILIWEDGRPLADGPMLAALYEVSARTVRRHCSPVRYTPKAGEGRGGGAALYDAFEAGDQLAEVAPRPERTLAALRFRMIQEKPGN